MAGLQDDLITIKRADAGKLIANSEEVNIIELISEVISDSKASFSHTPNIFWIVIIKIKDEGYGIPK